MVAILKYLLKNLFVFSRDFRQKLHFRLWYQRDFSCSFIGTTGCINGTFVFCIVCLPVPAVVFKAFEFWYYKSFLKNELMNSSLKNYQILWEDVSMSLLPFRLNKTQNIYMLLSKVPRIFGVECKTSESSTYVYVTLFGSEHQIYILILISLWI